MKNNYYFVKVGIWFFAAFWLMIFLDVFRDLPRVESDQLLSYAHWVYGICAVVAIGEYLYRGYFKKGTEI